MDHSAHQHNESKRAPTVDEERATELAQTDQDPTARGDAAHDTHARHEAATDGAHDKHAGHSVAMFRDRFWLSLVLTIPVLIWSEMVQQWLGYAAPTFPLSDRVPAIFGTVIFLFGGMPFLRGGVREVIDRAPGMMLLIAMAITVAFVASVASEFHAIDLEFWWELALLIDVMLLGHWQEMKAIRQASSALDALTALLPDEAEVVHGAMVHRVPVSELRMDDVVLVRPGSRVPADGDVIDGTADFDESMITGESRSIARTVGDHVIAGTVATDSSVRVSVTAVGEDTALAGIRRLVEAAQASRSRAQALADRAAAVLFYVAVVAGTLTFAIWSVIGTTSEAVERSVTVLVISCPHALGLAIPLVISISTAISAKAGILVRDRLALERMRTVDTVIFDKTGTLTRGALTVRDVVGVGMSTEEVLRLASAVEASREHPLGRAIVDAANNGGATLESSDFRSVPGRGVSATVTGSRVEIGGPRLLHELGLEEPSELAEATTNWRGRGATVLYVVPDGSVVGAIEAEDEIRPESVDAVRSLHQEGIRVLMITGDAREVAEAIARDVGVDEVISDVLPGDKADAVQRLRAEGRRVAMVGDGVNDAPALAGADVGIAIGAGTDVAIESAGVVLVSDDPRGVVTVRRLSSASYRKMVQNLGWAVGYNVVAIPLAAGVLASAGIVFAPAVGAIAMSVSTIVVAVNAMLLRRVDLSSKPAT
jgi:Cu2+-exporting ATPase